VAYVDAIAKSGYIVFKSDYRGHGNSEGVASGAYATPGYTLDVLNAMASLKKYKDADPNRIGMWGHSMGGQLTLRSLVTVRDIKAAVIWAGVVASYRDLLTQWRRPIDGGAPNPVTSGWRQTLTAEYGSPEENPQFWNSISPNTYVADIQTPIQLHHGTADASVPIRLSEILADELKGANKPYEFFRYPNDDHNLSKNLSLAMQRTVVFFDKYVKGK
jgi:dipeptidyl aminopeptidase/acylaminoacyl peptidase